MWRPQIGGHNGDPAQTHHQDRRPDPEYHPVGVRADRHERAKRTERGQRRQTHGQCGRQRRSGDHGAADAQQAVTHGHRGVRAQRPQHREVIAANAELAADHLPGDQQRRQPRDHAEHPQRDRLGLDRPLGCRLDDRQSNGSERQPLRDDPRDLRLHRGLVAAAPVKLDPGDRLIGAAPQQLPGQCGGEQHQRSPVGVDVVLHGIVWLGPADADQPRGDAPGRRGRVRRGVPRQQALRVRVDPERHHLPRCAP